MVLIAGGRLLAVSGNLTNKNARNAAEQVSKKKTLAKMATTAATVTEAERFGEESIKFCISFADGARKGGVKVTRRKKFLDVRFLFA